MKKKETYTWQTLFLDLIKTYPNGIVKIPYEWQKTISLQTLNLPSIHVSFITETYVVSVETNTQIPITDLSEIQYREIYLWLDLYTKYCLLKEK